VVPWRQRARVVCAYATVPARRLNVYREESERPFR